MSRPLRATGILGDRTVRRGQAPWRAVAHRGTLDEKRLAPAGGPRVPTEFPPPRDRDSSPPPRSLTRIAGSRTPGMCHLRPDRPASVAYATPLRGLPNGSQANPESRGSGTQAAKCSLSRAGPDVDWRVQAAAAVTNRRAPDGPSARSRRASGRQGRAPGYILSMIALASANGRPSNIPDRSAADQQGKTIRPPALRPVHRTTMAQHRCQVERLASAPRVASRWHARGETLPSRSGTVDRSDWSGREESNRANRPECPIGALVRAHRRRPLDSCDCRMRPPARTTPMGMTLDRVPSGARHPHAQRPHRPHRDRPGRLLQGRGRNSAATGTTPSDHSHSVQAIRERALAARRSSASSAWCSPSRTTSGRTAASTSGPDHDGDRRCPDRRGGPAAPARKLIRSGARTARRYATSWDSTGVAMR